MAARLAANLAAIRVVKALQAESRPATPAEQETLSGWSAWGAVAQVFPRKQGQDSPFPAQHQELQTLLTEEEYEAARRTVINAHYTAPAIARAMWEGLAAFGFSGGRVLEPGCGSGNFIGLAPLGTAIVGVELDPVTAQVAAALYPHARIRCESFAETREREGSFDAAIGNVPFGKIHLKDARHNPGRRHPIHTHFILKSAALTRPGGLIALITSRYTMDGTGADAVDARRQLAGLGELAAAIRLPAVAHRRTAGTTVVTDVLMIRRYDDGEKPPPGEPAWVQTVPVDVDGQQISINQHFASHPDMVLGELAAGGARSADDLQVIQAPGTDAAAALAAALARAAAAKEAAPPAPDPRPARWHLAKPPEGYQTANPDGTFSRIVNHSFEPFTPPGGPAEHAELRALLGVRDTALELLDAELATSEDAGLVDDLRARLNLRYDSYVAAYGPVNRYTPQIRVRRTPEGQALREQMLADGRARMTGGTVEITDPAAREQLVMARHATVDDNGNLRFRQTGRARAARQRLIDSGQARVTGGSLQITDAGKAWVLENIADLDEAVMVIRARPGQGGFRNDPFAARVQALEKYDPETGTAAKRDIMRHRVLLPRPAVEHADDPKDALAICMDRHGELRLDVIAGLLGAASEDEARARLGTLVFHDPAEGRLVPAVEYLSGYVREKLRVAETAAATDPAYQGNVAALKEVIPPDKGPADISARLGAVFITPGEVQQFLREILMDESVTVRLAGGKWHVAGGSRRSVAATITWGTVARSALELAENLLNRGAPIEITRTVEGKTVPDEEATLAAREKQAELSDRFAGWVWEDLDRAREVCRRYNETLNAIVLRSYDDVVLSLPGVNKDISLFWWQKAAIARMLYEPTALLGHDMGAGKTLEQIIGAMEQKRLGLIRKPVFVVKNYLLEQFRDEFLWAYPRAQIMCADSSDLAGDGRRNFIARAAAENPDAIIMTQRGFESIPLTPEGHEAYLAYMMDMFQVHAEAETDSVKDQVTMLTEFEQRLRAYFDPEYGKDEDEEQDARQAARKKKGKKRVEQDPLLCWEQLGADYILVDESQDYNNLWVPSAEPGMAIGFTHRAIDLEMKLHASRARYGSRVTTFATGTPVTNKIPQYYVLMRYLNPERLKKAGFHGYAPWAATHTEPEQRLEMKANGKFGLVTRMRLINVQELLLDLHYFGDFKDADDIGLPRPAIRGGKPEIRGVPGVPELYAWQATLPQRYNDAKQGGRHKEKGDDTVVAVLGDGFRAAQDLRLVRPRHGAWPSPPSGPQKIDHIAGDVYAEWLAHRDDEYPREDVRGSLQLVFCNEGVPRAGRWNLYDELRGLLTAKGMPRRLIRFVHEATDPDKKRALFAACNAGHVAVLVTSTEKGGVGLNVQRRCIGVQHVHPHWLPAYGEQEDARARRPGNLNAEVFIKWWLTERSFDTTRAQASERKAVFLRVIKHRDPAVRSIEVPGDDQVTFATMAAISAGEPRLIQKAELESQLRQLVRAQRRHANDQNALKVAEKQARAAIAAAEQTLRDIAAAETRIIPTAGDTFAMTIGDTRFRSRRDAGDRLIGWLRAAHARVPAGNCETRTAGRIGGLELTADLAAQEWREDTIVLRLAGLPGGTVPLDHRRLPSGAGVVARLENRLSGLGKLREEQHAAIDRQRQEITRAESAIGTPFAQHEALAAAKQALDALIAELRTDKDSKDPRAAEQGIARETGPSAADSRDGPAAGEAATSRRPLDPHPGPSAATGYQGARASALEVLGDGSAASVPDAEQFADFFARKYGHQDPGTWPLTMQVYADEWLPSQPADHPLKKQPSPAAPAERDAGGGDPEALFAEHWTASHPYSREIAAMRDAALADSAVTAPAQAGDWQNYQITFKRWASTYAGRAAAATPSTITAMQAALLDDPSFAADLTATLSHQVHLAGSGKSAPAVEQQVAGRVSLAAIDEAAAAWRVRMRKARTALCGCQAGCDQCALPATQDDRLKLAAEIDIHLARLGANYRDRSIGWQPPPGDAATGDPGAHTYTVTLEGETGGQPTWQLAIPAEGEFYRIAQEGRWLVTGGPQIRRGPDTAAQAAREFLRLAGPGTARPPGTPQTAAPAAARAPDGHDSTAAPAQDADLSALAAAHGLETEPGNDGNLLVRSAHDKAGSFAIRQDPGSGRLLSRSGRVIAPDRAGAYLAEYAAHPRAGPNALYRSMLGRLGLPGADADEHAWPKSPVHHALTDASCRARDTGAAHYLYADGDAYVCAAVPPAAAAYYSVTPGGKWSRRIDGATAETTGRPSAGQLSLISGELAEAGPPQAQAGQKPAPGPAPTPGDGQASTPADWTRNHPYAADIDAMRNAAMIDRKLRQAARVNTEQNFGLVFEPWATDYVAALVPGPDTAGQIPPFAAAFFDDHSFAPDLTATLRHHLYCAMWDSANGPPPAGDGTAVAGDAAREAAARWRRHIQTVRADECRKCSAGCAACALPADRDAELRIASEIDIHLARAGLRHTARGVTWHPPENTYAVRITGSGARWMLVVAPEPVPYRVLSPGAAAPFPCDRNASLADVARAFRDMSQQPGAARGGDDGPAAGLEAERRGAESPAGAIVSKDAAGPDTSAAPALIDAALDLADRRARNRVPADYDALNRMVRRQRAALTRAINSGDRGKVILAVRDAVREWDQPGALWPDDWSRWQCALDDVLPLRREADIRDLAAAGDTADAAAIIDAALSAADARARGRPPVDYGALNSMVKRQRATLAEAVSSGDVGRVILAVRDAVREWDQAGAAWPDDWARWQRALDNVLPLHRRVDIRDLATVAPESRGSSNEPRSDRPAAASGPDTGQQPATGQAPSTGTPAASAEPPAPAGTNIPPGGDPAETTKGGGYGSGPELADGQLAVGRAWQAVQRASQAAPARDPLLRDLIRRHCENVEALFLTAANTAEPEAAVAAYTAVATGGDRIAGAASDPGAAGYQYGLRSAAGRLALAARRHAARISAAGPAAAGLLKDSAAQDARTRVLTDPLGLLPDPYPDRAAVDDAREAIFAFRGNHPPSATGELPRSVKRLRAELAAMRMLPDRDHLGDRIDGWQKTLAATYAALAEAPHSDAFAGPLPGLARAIRAHSLRLNAYRIRAETTAAPYDSADAFAAGARGVAQAREAWQASATGARLGGLTDRSARESDLWEARDADRHLRDALYALSAYDVDAGLTRVAERATAAAHAAYALLLSHRQDGYRDPADQAILQSLTEAAYRHAASVTATRGAGTAPAVAAELARRATARRAPASAAEPAKPPAPEPVPGAPGAPEDGAAPPEGLVIEHHARGTLVRGTSEEDLQLRAMLHKHHFKWSKRLEAWYLGRNWTYSTRDHRVRGLIAELKREGRQFDLDTQAPAEQSTPSAPIEPGEPYTNARQAVSDYEKAWHLYWEARDTSAGRRLLVYAMRDSRPDARALKAADQAISTSAPFAGTMEEVTARFTAWAQAARTLTANLHADRYRAPRFREYLTKFAGAAEHLAARLAGTARDPSRWERVFAAVPTKQAHPATVTDAPAPGATAARPAATTAQEPLFGDGQTGQETITRAAKEHGETLSQRAGGTFTQDRGEPRLPAAAAGTGASPAAAGEAPPPHPAASADNSEPPPSPGRDETATLADPIATRRSDAPVAESLVAGQATSPLPSPAADAAPSDAEARASEANVAGAGEVAAQSGAQRAATSGQDAAQPGPGADGGDSPPAPARAGPADGSEDPAALRGPWERAPREPASGQAPSTPAFSGRGEVRLVPARDATAVESGPQRRATEGEAMPGIVGVTVLHGHTSPETAYLIEDYPYGFRLRCRMRVWIEQAAKGAAKGQYRVMRQTDDPKRAGRPWNNPKASTYSDWVVLYRDGEGHVRSHSGSLIYGLRGEDDARMRLDGTYEQLTGDERKVYNLMVKTGQRHGRWEHWHKALDFIRAHRAEHGNWPSEEDVRQAPGFHLDSADYGLAVAAARDLPSSDAQTPSADGQAPLAVGETPAAPPSAADSPGRTGSQAEKTAAAAGPEPEAGPSSEVTAGNVDSPPVSIHPADAISPSGAAGNAAPSGSAQPPGTSDPSAAATAGQAAATPARAAASQQSTALPDTAGELAASDNRAASGNTKSSAPAASAAQVADRGDQPDTITAPIWRASREAAHRAAAHGRTYHVYRDPAEGDIGRCVITAAPPRTAAGYLSVTAAMEWTETWRGRHQPLHPGSDARIDPDYPITLTEARALARACRMEADVTRAAGRAFVSLCEPGAAGAPAVSFEYGTRDVFAGRQAMAAGLAIRWLDTYRETADEWAAACGGDIFTATGAVDHWRCRVAHLVPHLPVGPDHKRAVAENLASAIRFARQGRSDDAERALRRAESQSPGLALAPAREAQIIERIEALAPGYHRAGDDPARIAETLQATPAEWNWIASYITAHPEVLQRRELTTRETQAAEAATWLEREAAAKDLSTQAKAERDAGHYGEALALLDDAELFNPVQAKRYERFRQVTIAAATADVDATAARETANSTEIPGAAATAPGLGENSSAGPPDDVAGGQGGAVRPPDTGKSSLGERDAAGRDNLPGVPAAVPPPEAEAGPAEATTQPPGPSGEPAPPSGTADQPAARHTQPPAAVEPAENLEPARLVPAERTRQPPGGDTTHRSGGDRSAANAAPPARHHERTGPPQPEGRMAGAAPATPPSAAVPTAGRPPAAQKDGGETSARPADQPGEQALQQDADQARPGRTEPPAGTAPNQEHGAASTVRDETAAIKPAGEAHPELPNTGRPAAGSQAPPRGNEAASRAAAPPPAAGGLPKGTEPLPAHTPWGGPGRPERLLYANGTPLDVRCQGDDADQTWQGTAAGAAPATGHHQPGRLQVVLWPSGTYTAVHPALTCPSGIDRYTGLSTRQRARWQTFDYFENWNGRTAYLECRLIDAGDVVELEGGGRSGGVDAREVLSVKRVPGGKSLRVHFESGPGTTMHADYSPGTLLGVVIPAHHPALAAAIRAAETAVPQPNRPTGADTAAQASPVPSAVPAADSPHRSARAQTGQPPAALAGVPQAAGEPAPGRGSITQPPPGDADGREPVRQPLTGSDIAVALKHIQRSDFTGLVRAAATGSPLPSVSFYGSGRNRRDIEPDPGADERLQCDSKGIQIEVATAAWKRAGTITWPCLAEWLRPGITAARRDLLEQADRAATGYAIHRDGFAATGQEEGYAAAVGEIGAIQTAAASAIIDAAATAHQQRGAAGRPSRRPRRAPTRSGQADTLFPSADLSAAGQEVTAALVRLTELISVLPPGRPDPWARASLLKAGDVVRHTGQGPGPYVLAERPRDDGDYFTFTGSPVRQRGTSPVIWQWAKNGDPDPAIPVVPLPGSLDQAAAATGQQPPPRRATEPQAPQATPSPSPAAAGGGRPGQDAADNTTAMSEAEPLRRNQGGISAEPPEQTPSADVATSGPGRGGRRREASGSDAHMPPGQPEVTARACYAFQRRQGARSIGRYHAVLDQPLSAGQFRRAAGDALCKPRAAFSDLSPGASREVTCPRCQQLAKRYGVTIIDGEAEPPPARHGQEPAPPHDASEAEPVPESLTGTDIAIALKHILPVDFTRLVRAAATGSAVRSIRWYFSGGNRRDSEPDPGADQGLDYDSKGIRIEVAAAGWKRAGAITWPRMAEWLRPGVTPARRDLLEQADGAFASYASHRDGFEATGQREGYEAALDEIRAIHTAVSGAIIDAAAKAHQQRATVSPGRRRQRGAARDPEQTSTLISGAGLSPADDHTAAHAARLTHLLSVLPPGGPDLKVPVSQLKAGDVVRNPGRALAAHVLTEQPRDDGGYFTFTSRPAGLPDVGPITWQWHKNRQPDPMIPVVPLPGRLEQATEPGSLATPALGQTIQPQTSQLASPLQPPSAARRAVTGDDQEPRRNFPGHTAPTARSEPPARGPAAGAAEPPEQTNTAVPGEAALPGSVDQAAAPTGQQPPPPRATEPQTPQATASATAVGGGSPGQDALDNTAAISEAGPPPRNQGAISAEPPEQTPSADVATPGPDVRRRNAAAAQPQAIRHQPRPDPTDATAAGAPASSGVQAGAHAAGQNHDHHDRTGPAPAVANEPAPVPAQGRERAAPRSGLRQEYVLAGTPWGEHDDAIRANGWAVANAPRPLDGRVTWTGDFRNGSLYAAGPLDELASLWLRDGAAIVVEITPAQALAMARQRFSSDGYNLDQIFAENPEIVAGTVRNEMRLPWDPAWLDRAEPVSAGPAEANDTAAASRDGRGLRPAPGTKPGGPGRHGQGPPQPRDASGSSTEAQVNDIYAALEYLRHHDPNHDPNRPDVADPLWHTLMSAVEKADLTVAGFEQGATGNEVHQHDATWVSLVHSAYSNGHSETYPCEIVMTIENAARRRRAIETAVGQTSASATPAPATPGPIVRDLAVLLGPYRDPTELADGRAWVQEAWTALREAALRAASAGARTAPTVTVIYGEVAAYVRQGEASDAWTAVAEAAARLGQAAAGPLADAARRLSHRAERHQARLIATGADTPRLAQDARGMPGDPGRMLVPPYTVADEVSAARYAIFGEAEELRKTGADLAALQVAVKTQQDQDPEPVTGVSRAMRGWAEVIDHALAAARAATGAAEQAAAVDLARMVYHHIRRLAAAQANADDAAANSPYSSPDEIDAAARELAAAVRQWRNSPTGNEFEADLNEGWTQTVDMPSERAQRAEWQASQVGPGYTEPPDDWLAAADEAAAKAHKRLIGADRRMNRPAQGTGLRGLLQQARAAAQAASDLQLNLHAADYRTGSDAQILRATATLAHRHAARLHASRNDPQLDDAIRQLGAKAMAPERGERARSPEARRGTRVAQGGERAADLQSGLRQEYVLAGTPWGEHDDAIRANGWAVANAPRPLDGRVTWTGDFRNGSLYAAGPLDELAGLWLRDGAAIVVEITPAQVLAMARQRFSSDGYNLDQIFAENPEIVAGTVRNEMRLPWDPAWLDSADIPDATTPIPRTGTPTRDPATSGTEPVEQAQTPRSGERAAGPLSRDPVRSHPQAPAHQPPAHKKGDAVAADTTAPTGVQAGAAADQDSGLHRAFVGALAAIAERRRPDPPAGRQQRTGQPGGFGDIWQRFTALKEVLAVPPPYDHTTPAVAAPKRSTDGTRPPAGIRPSEVAAGGGNFADIWQRFAAVEQALAGPPPYTYAALTAAGGDAGFADIWRGFAAVEQALAGPPPYSAALTAVGAGPGEEVLRPLATALADADASASWYRGTLEWKRITAVRDAAAALAAAVRAAAGSYWQEIRRDIRVHGFFRILGARVSRVISQAAYTLARKLEQAGRQESRPHRAAWRLHRAAADYAAQLMGYLPPGTTLDRISDVEKVASALRHGLQTARRGGGRGQGETPTAGPVSGLTHGLAGVARHLAELAERPEWRRLARLAGEAERLVIDAARGAAAFHADAVAIGTARAVWARTCEFAADMAWDLMGRLGKTGRRGGPGWNAARVLHHAARENIAHAYGLLEAGCHLPLGAYSGRSAEARARGGIRPGEIMRPEFPHPVAAVAAGHSARHHARRTVTSAPPPRATVRR